MAYGKRFAFRFDSVNGTNYEIYILQKDYSGAVINRSLGQSPVLRREENGKICGSSLELYAECLTDGEFVDLYTTDAFYFKTEVYSQDALIWTGFVSPELYSEPDIAPPYDVQIIATDGLGELKNYEFEAMGVQSLRSLLTALLSHTGQSCVIDCVSELRPSDMEGSTAGQMLDQVSVNIDFLAGTDCYEVLQTLLDSLDATLFYNGGRWMLFRESDLDIATDGTAVYHKGDTPTVPAQLHTVRLGSMNTCDWWPVGQLSSKVVPAQRQVVVSSENNYTDSALLNSSMSSDTDWTKTTGASYDSEEKAYLLEGTGSISQKITFSQSDTPDTDWARTRLMLAIKVRTTGGDSGGTPGSLKVTVKGKGRRSVAFTQDYYLREDEGVLSFRPYEADIQKEVEAPAEGQTRDDAETIELVLPLYTESSSSPRRGFCWLKDLEITIASDDSWWGKYIYAVQLYTYDQVAGYRDTLRLDNGARSEGDETVIAFARTDSTYASQTKFLQGVLIGQSAPIVNWQDLNFGPADYLSVISRDYALSVVLPRLQKEGRVNVPEGAVPPMLFRGSDGIDYILKTFSWDLLEDEMDIEILSAPAARLIVEAETVEAVSAAPTEQSIAGSAAGGSGSGGTMVSWGEVNDYCIELKVGGRSYKLLLDDGLFTAHKDSDGALESIEGKAGIWTPSFMSAGGKNTEGGGGGSATGVPFIIPTGLTTFSTQNKTGGLFNSANLVMSVYDNLNRVVVADIQVLESAGKYYVKVDFKEATPAQYRLVVFG